MACDERVIALRVAYRGHATNDGSGEFAICLGQVNVVEGGRGVSLDVYDYDDDAAMLARYAELSGSSATPAGHQAEFLFAGVMRRYNDHDLEGVLECLHEGLSLVDHRVLGWEPVHGRADLEHFYRSVFQMSPDIRMEIDEVLACDDRVIAANATFRGSGTEGVGAAELPLGYVAVFESGRMVSQDVYEHDDRQAMVARYAELGGGQAPLGDRAPERVLAEYARRFARRDPQRLFELYVENFVIVDHRKLGWEEVRGRDAAAEINRSAFAGTRDLRFEIDEVLACDELGIAVRGAWCGTAVDGGGELAIPVGIVMLIEDGRMVSHDFYDHDDREAMLARFAELGGRDPGLADTPPKGALVAWLSRHDELLARGDWDTLRDELIADDVLVHDRRGIPPSDASGVEAYRALLDGGATSTLLASDGDVLLARNGSDPPLLLVGELRDGRLVEATVLRDEERARTWFEALIIARIVEACAAAGDYAGAVADVFHPGARLVDHRPMKLMGASDVADIGQLISGSIELVDGLSGVYELLEVRRGAAAAVSTWRGTDRASGGAVEWHRFGAVRIREGRWEETHVFEDAEGALAQLDELSPPTQLERATRRYVDCLNARNWDGLAALYTGDFVVVDHRLVGWEDVEGAAALIELIQGFLAMAADMTTRVEPLDDDGGPVSLARQVISGTWEGAPVEVAVETVTVLRDGHLARLEIFDLDQRDAIHARLAELRAGAGPGWSAPFADYATVVDRRDRGWGTLVGGDAAAERLGRSLQGKVLLQTDEAALVCGAEGWFAIASLGRGEASYVEIHDDESAARDRFAALAEDSHGAPTMRLAIAWLQALNRRDVDAARACLVDDFVMVDHRPASPFGVRGADTYLEQIRSLFELSDDVRWLLTSEVEIHGAVVRVTALTAGHWKLGGGRAEMLFGIVLSRRGDRFDRFEVYPAEAVEEQRARLAELAAERASLDHDAARPEVANDADDLHLADDVTLIDRRRDGLGTLHGAEGVRARLGRPLRGEALLQTDEAALVRGADGWFAIAALDRGEVAYVEIYDDEQNARERYAALALDPDSAPTARTALAFGQALNRRDMDAARACLVDDFVVVDHRPASVVGSGVRSADAYLAAVRSLLELSDDVRFWLTSAIEFNGAGCRYTVLITGHWNLGGGRAEMPSGIIASRRGDRFDRWEVYPAEAVEEQRARLAQLAAERASPDHDAARPKVANDADDLHLDDDVSLIDCRRDGWGTLHGAEAVTGRLGRPLQGEVLAQTDEAALVCGVDGWFAVALLGRGEVAYVEIFEDEQNGRERYAALAQDPDSALTARIGLAWFQALNRRDMDAARACLADDIITVDHRPVSPFGSETRGGDACFERIRSLLELSGDARWWITSDIEICGEVCRLTYLIAGRWNAGGGRAEIPIGIVVSRRGERMDRWELFPPEAVKEQRARLAQLAAERASQVTMR